MPKRKTQKFSSQLGDKHTPESAEVIAAFNALGRAFAAYQALLPQTASDGIPLDPSRPLGPRVFGSVTVVHTTTSGHATLLSSLIIGRRRSTLSPKHSNTPTL